MSRRPYPKPRQYLCAKCGNAFFSNGPKMVGYSDLHECKEGESVGDVAYYICDECASNLTRTAA